MTDMTIANTILAQLGGRRFTMMTGAKDYVGGEDYLMFRIGRNSTRVNKVKITLTSRDDYTMEFMYLRKFETKVLETVEGATVENIREIFTQKTGMEVSL